MNLSRGVRTRLQLVVLVSVAAALVLTIAGFNLLLWRSLSADANSRSRSVATDETEAVRVVNGVVTLSESDVGDLQSQVWVFSGVKVIKEPRVNATVDQAARTLAESTGGFMDVPGEHVRLFAMPISSKGQRVGTIVSGVSLVAYEHTRSIALIGSLLLALVVLLMAGLGTRLLVTRALRPVTQMTADAEAWSVRDLDRRFALGEPHDEISLLAAGFDSLLDRLAASLRRERRFSAEISHELRTPLAKISAEAELALRRPREAAGYQETLNAIMRQTRQMTQIVDTLVTVSQQESGLVRGRCEAAAVLEEVAAACAPQAASGGVTVTIEPSSSAVELGLEIDVATRILQPVVENACLYARSAVQLSVRKADSGVLFSVFDDGPGVTEEERDAIFDPGVRGNAARDHARHAHGAGLGLALARRLARAASGDVTVGAGGEPGGCFLIRLPEG